MLSVNKALMAGRLILIAHAETDATRRAAFPLDEPLSDRGHVAAERYAAALPHADKTLRSPAAAAADTAAAFKVEAAIEPMLADFDCGRWRGRTLSEVANAEPESLGAWLTDPAFAGHGGSSIGALLARVEAWLEAQCGERGVTLAITHATVVRCAVLAVLRAPATGFWRLDVGPLTRVELSSDGRRWALRQIVQAEGRPSDQK